MRKIPRLQICENPKKVAFRSWSLWLNRLGLLVLIAPELLYSFTGIDYNPYLAGILWVGLSIGVEASRYIRQSSLHSPVAIMVLALFLAMGNWEATTPTLSPTQPSAEVRSLPYTKEAVLEIAMPLVKRWEGLRLRAYQDSVGVWTICFGETDGVQPGDVRTEAECEAMLEPRLLEHRAGWLDALTAETLQTRLHPNRDAAFSSWTYNIGVHAARTSTATKRLNAGNIAGACKAATWFKKGGGRVILGLVRRRSHEYEHCMVGVA